MKILGLIALFSLCMVIFLFIKGRKERYSDPPNGTIINHEEDEPMFMENDEFSPEQLDVDKTLKVLRLRNKLKEIEKERSDGNKSL